MCVQLLQPSTKVETKQILIGEKDTKPLARVCSMTDYILLDISIKSHLGEAKLELTDDLAEELSDCFTQRTLQGLDLVNRLTELFSDLLQITRQR